MVDASDDDVVEGSPGDPADAPGDEGDQPTPRSEEPAGDEPEEFTTEELRREVEEKYDFDDFGPAEMEEMTAEEWDAVFDPDTWITGPELLDRVEADLKHRVVTRDVFARVERVDGRIVAYSDEGYAVVHPDGTVEGRGTVLRDVKPTIALCSMDSYDAPEMPDGEVLPEPAEVPEGSGELGNLMLQVVAGIQVLAGIGLVGAWILTSLGVVGLVAGLGFLVIGLVLFTVVANARLSDRFRAEEYRTRLRAIGLESGERPDFVPIEGDRYVGDGAAGDGREDADAEAAMGAGRTGGSAGGDGPDGDGPEAGSRAGRDRTDDRASEGDADSRTDGRTSDGGSGPESPS